MNYFNSENHENAQSIETAFEVDNNTFFNRVRGRAETSDSTSGLAKLDASFGKTDSLNTLIGSNSVARLELLRALCSASRSLRDVDVGIVSIVNSDWALDPERPVVDLKEIHRGDYGIKKLAPTTFKTVQFGCLPSTSGESYKIVPIVYLLIAGEGIRETAPSVAARLQLNWRSSGLRDQPLAFDRWLEPVSRRSMMATFASLLRMGDPLAGMRRQILAEEAFDRAAWTATADERAQRLYCIQTLCPLDKLLTAGGELQPRLSGALNEARQRASRLYAEGEKALHRDEILHFWIEYYARRGEKPFIPFIRHR